MRYPAGQKRAAVSPPSGPRPGSGGTRAARRRSALAAQLPRFVLGLRAEWIVRVVLFTLACAPVMARGGTVSGCVVHGVSELPVSGVPVAFQLVGERGTQEMVRCVADQEGRFSFSGPFIGNGTPFALVAWYREVPHATSTLQAGAQQEVIVEVYEPTSDPGRLWIAAHNLFLVAHGDGLDVAQLIQLENRGERTYVAPPDARSHAAFALPRGTYGLRNRSGKVVPGDGTRAYYTEPVLPGQTQITFTHSLDVRHLGNAYEHQVLLPTGRLDVFLSPSSLPLGAAFQDLGVVELQGMHYSRGRRLDLSPGQTVRIPLPQHTDWHMRLRWSALALACLAVAVAWCVSQRLRARGAAAPAVPPGDAASLQAYRTGLIERLAELDDAYAGATSDKDYQNERARLVEEAVAISLTVRGTHHEPI